MGRLTPSRYRNLFIQGDVGETDKYDSAKRLCSLAGALFRAASLRFGFPPNADEDTGHAAEQQYQRTGFWTNA
jgi:hypothetical protein